MKDLQKGICMDINEEAISRICCLIIGVRLKKILQYFLRARATIFGWLTAGDCSFN